MLSNFTNNKTIVIFAFILCLISLFVLPQNSFKKAYAENESVEQELENNIKEIIDDIDSSALDEFVESDLNVGFDFKTLVLNVLSGDYLLDNESLVDYIKNAILLYFNKKLRFFISLLVISLLFVIFNNFCQNRYIDLKKIVKTIFVFILAISITLTFKDFYEQITDYISEMFRFANILFPIIVSLLALSGAASSATIFSSFSAFILNTGNYLIVYILLPLSLSMMLLAIFAPILKNKSAVRFSEICKICFKYVIIIFTSVLGILSTVNLVMAGSKDGINMKLTKYAIKNYVPILGGYISEGFDYLRGCSILLKNSFGVCGIIILIYKMLSPLLIAMSNVLGYKMISVVSSYFGEGSFSDMFNSISKSFSYFVTIVIGTFLILFIFLFLLVMSVWVI